MDLVKQIIKDINNSKKLNLILTGGSSPIRFYKKLFKQKKVKWDKVNFFLKDERLVKINSKKSNFKHINFILKKNKLLKKLKPLDKNSTDTKNTTFVVDALKKNKTICFLGLGYDGHFASIFTKSKKYRNLIDLRRKPNFIITEKIGDPFLKRITMNLSMLNKSSKFYIILDNVKKINLFKDILTSKDTSKYSILNLINLAKNRISVFDGHKIRNLKEFKKIY